MSPTAMWLLFLVWKRSGAGGVMVLTSTLSVVHIHHVLLLLVHCRLPVSPFSMWPLLFKWENERGLLLTWNYGDSDDDRCCHCLDDMARLLTCQVVTMNRCASSSWWCGNTLLLLLLACMVVVGGSRTVVAEGGGGRKLFVCWCHVSALLGKCHSCSFYIR